MSAGARRRWMALVGLCAVACQRRADPGGSGGDGSSASATTLVFAAASTADALEAHARRFEAETGCPVRFSFASSQDLARQIELGAPADLFLSADPALIDDLVRKGLTTAQDTARWMSNQLVIIVPRGEAPIASAAELARVAHLALGDPERVPAGRYARAWLQKEGVWPAVQGRVVPALDVRAALAMVEAGRADAGIVYRSDAAHDARVRVTYEVPVDASAPIVYRAAQLARGKTRCGAELMAAWRTQSARELFTQHGFLP